MKGKDGFVQAYAAQAAVDAHGQIIVACGLTNNAADQAELRPVIGQIKQARGFRQFLLRGVAEVTAEWALVCAAHNLTKLLRVTESDRPPGRETHASGSPLACDRRTYPPGTAQSAPYQDRLLGVTRVLSYQIAKATRAGTLAVALKESEPAPWPVSLVYAGQGLLPLKLRAFLDFAASRLKAGLSQDAA